MSATGSDIADVLDSPVWRAVRRIPAAGSPGTYPSYARWAQPKPIEYSFGALPPGVGTVALHVLAGLNERALRAGVLAPGATAEAERWAGELLSARGYVVMVHSAAAVEVRTPALPAGRAEVHLSTELPTAIVRGTDVERAVELAVERDIEILSGSAAAVLPTAEDDLKADDTVPGEPPLALSDLARSLHDVPAAVPVERPEVPELTDRPLENIRRLFGLTAAQLADLFGVTERQAHRYLREGLPEGRRALADALVAVGLTVVGGLGPQGAQRWLFSGRPPAAELARTGRLDELRDRADALRDSPVT